MRVPMRQLAAMFLLLGILPVLLFGFSVECSGVGCGAASCCLAPHEEGEDVLLCHGAGEAGRFPSHHHHEHLPLLRDAGERREGGLTMSRVPLVLPGGGVEIPASVCPVALGLVLPCGVVGEKRPMWVPLRC